MPEEPISTLTKKYVSATDPQSSKSTKYTSNHLARQSRLLGRLSHLLTGIVVFTSGLVMASNWRLTEVTENQAQSAFYQFRGSLAPPKEILILAIDDESISTSALSYNTDPVRYHYLEPLKTFPFYRAGYAQIIDKLMKAGARSVALNVVFDVPSSYGEEDDKKLQATLKRYGNRVTLAGLYQESDTDYWKKVELRQPLERFSNQEVAIGSVNFLLEDDGKIHKLGSAYNNSLLEDGTLTAKIPSFAEATLASAQFNYPQPQGDRIYYRGTANTFKTIPLWYVLEPAYWNNNLQQGRIFKDKIVLVGATAQLANDFHPVAVNWLYPQRMAGVEIHANAIASLMQGNTVAIAIPNKYGQALFVMLLVGGCGFLITRNKHGKIRLFSSLSLALIWGGISYILFITSHLFFPTAIPIAAIVAIGLFYFGTEIYIERMRKIQLVDILKRNPSSRLAQEIISQQEDLQDLIAQREIAIFGKVLDGRYRIVKVLGSGGFSETYIAEDIRLPGNPRCVVKQLKPANTEPKQLEVARRLFNSEAQTLQILGSHPQIPQLLAFFEEEEEFYLVQELIQGNALNKELSGKCIDEMTVIDIFKDLLQILTFVHQHGVIHRDIKPSNIIVRKSDRKLVLIDFGAVKQVSTTIVKTSQDSEYTDSSDQTALTVGIGTKGYAPREQCFGRPEYSSDIYAVGMIGIKALTGIPPHELERDEDGEVQWLDKLKISQGLAAIINKMVLDRHQQRYQSAAEVLQAVDILIASGHIQTTQSSDMAITLLSPDESDIPTTPWDLEE
ncbi:serine/threonine-protein kinase [Calothrix sp. PCC 6303]|uniref:serine/threonine-protein kinase n=1 Tax=Calothrix sp. PCC 6303 TaxID=1170562 RepID=UPI0002A01AEF|nr:serine/threonine-protein kinase [Calothrix sp. PCC 6303]AFZ03126.1 serine/threonine protein kinase with Chase2 sensor [Calothrix sp. PCC 6303]